MGLLRSLKNAAHGRTIEWRPNRRLVAKGIELFHDLLEEAMPVRHVDGATEVGQERLAIL
jgi:hypothetical protein